MRIKKLEVVGFKSFLEKTTFYFNVPITSIVGPNGCGKSNVVDALKWVTGELSFKELRGRSMEDLIFAGSETRPPTGMMEVALTLDNSEGTAPPQYKDFSEITVLRRIFRDGTSEFYINKVPCRLRDIIDVFLDTGIGQTSYSIIEQGRVGAIVSGRPEDRRLIIEEAAGITKYKHRKKAAQRKIEYTKQNLLRVTDVLAELKRQINSLERQARQAERFREARDQARTLDISLSARDYLSLGETLTQLARTEAELSDRWQAEETELTAKEVSIEKLRLELLKAEKDLGEAQQNLFNQGAAVQTLESRREALKREAAQLRETAEAERARIAQLAAKREQFQNEITRLVSEITRLEADRKKLESDLNEAAQSDETQKERLRSIETEIEKEKETLLGAVAKEAELKNQMATSHQRMAELDRQTELRSKEHERIAREKEQLERLYAEQQQSLGAVVQMRFSFEQDQTKARAKMEELQTERNRTADSLSETIRQLEGHRSRFKALDEFTRTYQGYRKGVRTVMEKQAAPESPVGKVLGLLGELVKPARGYERAVQAALAEWIECVVVDSSGDALQAVEFLRGDGRGRGAFLPRGLRQPERKASVNQPGVLGWLLDFITIDESHKPSIETLLGDVLLVENLPVAISLRGQGIASAMVSPAGDMLSREGVIAGGNWDEERGVLEMKKEIEDLRETIEAGEKTKTEMETLLARLQTDINLTTSDLSRIGQDLERESKKSFDHEKDFHRIEETLRHIRQGLDVSTKELVRLSEDRSAAAAGLETARVQQEQIEVLRRELEAGLKTKADLLAQTRAEAQKHAERTTALRVEQASFNERHEAYSREQQSLLNQDRSAEEERNGLLESSAKHDASALACEEEGGKLETERQEAISLYTKMQEHAVELRSRHDAEASKIHEEEAGLKKSREERDALLGNLNTHRMQLREENIRLEHMVSQVFERYAVSLPDAVKDPAFMPIENEKAAGAQQELQALRDKMAKIGDVNLAAIDEVKQLQERFTFLTAQKEDLEQSLEALATAIRKINTTTRERFIHTFGEVSTKFETIFPRLFRGGKGKLVLTDPENILESGVDIVAQPPGKRLQSMNLMSGGEKALTAIALLFAIFEHKAPPFCVLDEVDAPLDDVNVRRFLSMVKEMSAQTQFIIITHNKGTMESAENLYGVTMEEPGVSRMVSVRVHQLAAAETVPMPAEPAVAPSLLTA